MRSLNGLTQRVVTSVQMLVAVAAVWLGMCAPVAADIAVVVHPSNPLSALSEDEVRRIFMGRMRMFPESDGAIETVDQQEASTAFADFYQAIARLTPAKLKRQRASFLFSGKGRLPTALQDDAAVIDFVASHPDAIGYVDVNRLDARVKSVLTVNR